MRAGKHTLAIVVTLISVGFVNSEDFLLNQLSILAKTNCSVHLSKQNNLEQGGNHSTLLSTSFTVSGSSDISVVMSRQRNNSEQKHTAICVASPDLWHGGKMLNEDRMKPSHLKGRASCE